MALTAGIRAITCGRPLPEHRRAGAGPAARSLPRPEGARGRRTPRPPGRRRVEPAPPTERGPRRLEPVDPLARMRHGSGRASRSGTPESGRRSGPVRRSRCRRNDRTALGLDLPRRGLAPVRRAAAAGDGCAELPVPALRPGREWRPELDPSVAARSSARKGRAADLRGRTGEVRRQRSADRTLRRRGREHRVARTGTR